MYIQRGRQQGLQKGKQQGEAAVLMRLLQRRFGDNSKAYEQRIHEADVTTLLAIEERILEAKTLEEMFD
ncbi:MAG: DUF4351 domain-containing protein [Gammaproteobacteria bacterium]